MPRNSNGDYSLPAGNPVVTGTTISSTWANTTLADLANAMTDSLSRSGDGSMLAPLFLDDGAVGAPALSWGNETTSGLYRAGAGDFRYSTAGVDRIQIFSSGLRTISGAAATPSHGFITDPNTGMYLSGSDDAVIAAGGTDIAHFTSNAGATPQFRATDGVVGNPAISFNGDPDTGFYRLSANAFSVAVGAVEATRWFNNAGVGQTLVADGTSAIPGIAFSNDADTGMYLAGANTLAFSTAGVPRLNLNPTRLLNDLPMYEQDGSVGAPAYSFTNDTDTGLHRAGTNDLSLIAGATRVLAVAPTGTYSLDGGASIPAYSFLSDPDTGIYRSTANLIGLAAGGAGRLFVGTQGAGFIDGAAATPSHYFDADTNTGLYRAGSDDLTITAGGVDIAHFTSNAGSVPQARFVNGALANPSIAFHSNPDTGLYLPGSGITMVYDGTAFLQGTDTALTIGANSGYSLQFLSITSGTANTGASGAAPAQVAGYLAVLINGTNRKIPYYAN